MKVPVMQEHKVRRAIAAAGTKYPVFRKVVDERGQPVRGADNKLQYEQVAVLKGIYHESGTFFTLLFSDAAEVKTKKQSQIVCMWKDLIVHMEGKDDTSVQVGDRVFVKGKAYDIDAVRDVQDWHIFADLSLELFDDGTVRV